MAISLEIQNKLKKSSDGGPVSWVCAMLTRLAPSTPVPPSILCPPSLPRLLTRDTNGMLSVCYVDQTCLCPPFLPWLLTRGTNRISRRVLGVCYVDQTCPQHSCAPGYLLSTFPRRLSSLSSYFYNNFRCKGTGT